MKNGKVIIRTGKPPNNEIRATNFKLGDIPIVKRGNPVPERIAMLPIAYGLIGLIGLPKNFRTRIGGKENHQNPRFIQSWFFCQGCRKEVKQGDFRKDGSFTICYLCFIDE
jgi:hypothetical protein